MKKMILLVGMLFMMNVPQSCTISTKAESSTEALQTPADISEQDKMFLAIASSAGIMEVELGKLAVKKGVRKDVKDYGQMMVKEHTKVNNDFRKLLKKLKVTVPGGMNDRNAQMVREHAALRGQEFDTKYIQTMIDDHKLATEKFAEALEIAKNEDYKKFLASMIPIVKMHYEMALDLQNGSNDNHSKTSKK